MAKLRSGYLPELNDEDRKIALEELGEDPKQTAERIQDLRKAVLQMKHLTAPTDDEFLLLFLRHAKFSQSRALDRIDIFIKRRITDPYKQLYITDGAMDPTALRALQIGICVGAPTLPESGIRTLIFRSGLVNTGEMSAREAHRASIAGTEMLLRSPVSQIRGMQFIIDDCNVSASYCMQVLSPTSVKIMLSAYLNVTPCRVKSVHLVRTNSAIKVGIRLAKRLMTAKLASRIFIHDSLESLHSVVSSEVLPTELGGSGGTYEEMTAQGYDLVSRTHEEYFQKYTCCTYNKKK